MLKSLIVAAVTLLIGATPAAWAGPLHDTVKDGDLGRLQELIAAGEDLTAQDKFVGTALHWAALKDNADAARLLIDAGADVNLPRIGSQQTALHIVAERGSTVVAKLLIEAGADIAARTDYRQTPLHMAAGADQVEVADLLIEAGADIEARNIGGATPLMQAATGNAVRAIELLVAEGANIDAKTAGGRTALHGAAAYLAAAEGGADGLRTLIELGADVNGAPDTEPVFPSTPLATAIALGQHEAADILREAGASE